MSSQTYLLQYCSTIQHLHYSVLEYGGVLVLVISTSLSNIYNTPALQYRYISSCVHIAHRMFTTRVSGPVKNLYLALTFLNICIVHNVCVQNELNMNTFPKLFRVDFYLKTLEPGIVEPGTVRR